MFAIQNQKTHKFLCGTDYRYYPYRQRTSHEQMLTFEIEEDAIYNHKHRKCGKDYRVVKLKPVEVERVIEGDYCKGGVGK